MNTRDVTWQPESLPPVARCAAPVRLAPAVPTVLLKPLVVVTPQPATTPASSTR
jgi:hypothetical protein